MKPFKLSLLFAVGFSAMISTQNCGVCLQQFTVKAPFSGVDLKKAVIGSASIETSFQFRCCPTEDAQKTATRLKEALEKSFGALMVGAQTEDDFKKYALLVSAAEKTLLVLLKCDSNTETQTTSDAGDKETHP